MRFLNINSDIIDGFKKTWGLLKKNEKVVVLSLSVAGIVGSLLDMVSLISVMPLISIIIDPGIIESNKYVSILYRMIGNDDYERFIILLSVAICSLIFFSVLFNYMVLYVAKLYGVKFQDRLVELVMKKIMKTPYAWFLAQNTTVLSRHVYNDVLMWNSDGVQRIITLSSIVSLLVFAIIVVCVAAPEVGLVGVIIVGFSAFGLMSLIRKKLVFFSEVRRSSDSNTIHLAKQIFSGVKDIKLSTNEGFFINYFVSSFNNYGKAMVSLKMIQMLPAIIMMGIGQIGLIYIAVILKFSGYSSADIAAKMALILLVTARIIPSMTRLTDSFNGMLNARPHIIGLCDLIDKVNKQGSIEYKKNKEIMNWSEIGIRDLSYSYPDTDIYVLKNINLTIVKGKSYGVVGRSGSGKSTLVDLILGLLSPTKGSIFIDDKNLEQLNKEPYYRKIGYVPQSPFITNGTLKENIAFGIDCKLIDENHVKECLDKVDLTSLYEDKSLEMQLGENGIALSGGQRQRVALARALYIKPEILILDEATSSLDAVSENIINNTIHMIKGEMTIIIIAHRYTLIRNCDEIILLDDGELLDVGDYSGLYDSSSGFRQMVNGLENQN